MLTFSSLYEINLIQFVVSDVSTAVNGFINNYLNDTPRPAVETLDINHKNADTVFITLADI